MATLRKSHDNVRCQASNASMNIIIRCSPRRWPDPGLKYAEVESADLLLLNFCKEFERLYGKGACTPNMHLHMHLKACLLDYGPPHAFWCYPFERYYGILGQYNTNRRAIESQLLKKFCHSQAVVNGNISTSEFGGFLPTKSIKQRECPRYKTTKIIPRPSKSGKTAKIPKSSYDI